MLGSPLDRHRSAADSAAAAASVSRMSGPDAVMAVAAAHTGEVLNGDRILPSVFSTPTKGPQSHSRRGSLNGSGSTGALLSAAPLQLHPTPPKEPPQFAPAVVHNLNGSGSTGTLSSPKPQPTPPKEPPPFAPATIQMQLAVVDKSAATTAGVHARPAPSTPSHASSGGSGGVGSNGHAPASSASFVVSPPKFGSRSIRSRPLSRDSSKEMLPHAASAIAAAAASAAAVAAVPSRSSSTSSLTTTSIFTSPPPLQPGVGHPQQHHTLISTTTSFSASTPAGTRTLSDESRGNHVSLPSVTTTSNTNAATSLTASLLAAANKDSLPTLLQLPQIVSAQQQRLLLLESLTSSQGESIIELQRTIRNLQKQLVFVMAAVPSLSGTGGVASLQPQSRSRGSSSGTTDGTAGLQPHRSRSSTELREGQGASGQQPLSSRASKRLSGSDRDRDRDRHHGLHSGSHTHSTESMESLPHSHRSSKPSSRPTSKTSSRYGSPRNAGTPGVAAAAAHLLSSNQQAAPAVSNISSAKPLHSSHHFAFHPSTISSQPPPGQLHVDHSVGIAQTQHSTPGSSRRAKLVASQAPETQHPHPPHNAAAVGVLAPGSSLRPSRRLTPPHMEEVQQHLQHQQLHQQQQQQQQQSHHHHHHHHHAHHPQSQIQPLAYASAQGSNAAAHPHHAPAQSLDAMRPLPLQHTVTRGKHGVTEYVLSFRDDSGGQEQYLPPAGEDDYDAYGRGGGTHGHGHGHIHGHTGHAPELSEVQEYDDEGNNLEYSRSGSYAYRNHAHHDPLLDSVHGTLSGQAAQSTGPAPEPAPSPRSARVEIWKQQQSQGAPIPPLSPAASAVKEKKKSRKSGDRRSGSGAFSAAGLPLSTTAAATGGAALIDIDRRDAHAQAHAHAHASGDSEDPSSAPTGATAAALRKAARKKEKEKAEHARGGGSERKLCKVAGCGELRLAHGTDKYCKAHSGPAPINPNARKMMFQH